MKVPAGKFDAFLVEPELGRLGGVVKRSKAAAVQIWVSADRTSDSAEDERHGNARELLGRPRFRGIGIAYLYTPYSFVKSIMALTFSGLASSRTVEASMMNPPSLPTTSISSLQ